VWRWRTRPRRRRADHAIRAERRRFLVGIAPATAVTVRVERPSGTEQVATVPLPRSDLRAYAVVDDADDPVSAVATLDAAGQPV